MDRSIMLPIAPVRAAETIPFFGVAKDAGSRLWTGAFPRQEPHQLFAYAAGLGYRVPAGVAVSVAALRHPLEAARQAKSAANFTGRSLVAGVGTGTDELVGATTGAPYRSPITAMREYTEIMRAALNGRNPELTGEYHVLRDDPGELDSPPVSIGLAALRPRMAELAGRVADVVICWLTPLPYLRSTLIPAVRAGAEQAGRTPPRIVVMVPMAVAGPNRDVFELAQATYGSHIRLPHYIAMLRAAGIDVSERDPEARVRRLIDDGVFAVADPRGIAAILSEYAAEGVDEVVLTADGVVDLHGPDAAVHDYESVLSA